MKDEHFTAILSIKHAYRESRPVTLGLESSERHVDYEVGKIVVRADSLNDLKLKLKAHVEIL